MSSADPDDNPEIVAAKAQARLALDKRLIREAMEYNQDRRHVNEVYLGSLAVAGLYHVLKIRYGQPGFAEALEAADQPTVDVLIERCKSVIDHMLKNPTKTCPTCGATVEAK